MGWVKMDGESSTLVSTYFSPLRSLVDVPFSCSISQDWFLTEAVLKRRSF